jgi:hypothetical protein
MKLERVSDEATEKNKEERKAKECQEKECIAESSEVNVPLMSALS